MNFDQAQALEIEAHDKHGDRLEIKGIVKSGNGCHYVVAWDRAYECDVWLGDIGDLSYLTNDSYPPVWEHVKPWSKHV